MARLLILVILVGLVLWFLHWFRTTPPERVARVLRKGLIWGLVALLVLATLSGRLSPILAAISAAIGAAIPLIMRAVHLLRLVPALQQLLRSLGLAGSFGAGQAGASARVSSIRTRYLAMRLDHATGALEGTVLEGPFKGRELKTLRLGELLRLHELYRDSDAQSLAVLESYLDREHGDGWRDRVETGSDAGPPPSRDGKLSEAEARSILGVEADADADAIRAAHRRLMQRLHPDRGGSDYLAAKINAAKRRLLGES